MSEYAHIKFKDNETLCKLLRIGSYAPWKRTSSKRTSSCYWDLGNDTLYQLCESYPLPGTINDCDVDFEAEKSKDEAVFSSKMWLIGRSYAASPERYSYGHKKDDEKRGKKPKEVDPEGYESFFDDIAKILFRGACYYRGEHIGDENVIKTIESMEAGELKTEFKCFLEKAAELGSRSYSFAQSVHNDSQKTDTELVRDAVECVVKFASLLQHARYVRDLGVVAKNPKDKKGEEQVPPELGNQSFPLSFSSKFLHFHIPQLIFIYDGISSGNLHVGYKKAKTVNLKFDNESILEIPGNLKYSDREGDESDETLKVLKSVAPENRDEFKKEKHYEEVYFEHALKELYVANCLYCSVDEDERGYLTLGQVDGSKTEPPCFYYLTRMVDSLVTNADQNKKR